MMANDVDDYVPVDKTGSWKAGDMINIFTSKHVFVDGSSIYPLEILQNDSFYACGIVIKANPRFITVLWPDQCKERFRKYRVSTLNEACICRGADVTNKNVHYHVFEFMTRR